MTFEEHVRRALDSLPPPLAKALENLAVVVEEEAPDDPDLFGLWESAEYLPDKIMTGRPEAPRLTRFRASACTVAAASPHDKVRQ